MQIGPIDSALPCLLQMGPKLPTCSGFEALFSDGASAPDPVSPVSGGSVLGCDCGISIEVLPVISLCAYVRALTSWE